ncbi:MAG: hypothetical protein ACMUIP_12945 [bacterium]
MKIRSHGATGRNISEEYVPHQVQRALAEGEGSGRGAAPIPSHAGISRSAEALWQFLTFMEMPRNI